MDALYMKTEEKDEYSTLQTMNNEPTDAPTAMTSQLHRSRNEGVVPDFIQKLFNMLESTDETSCYRWGPQGTTFVIDDTNEFAKTVLPSRFKHGNFSSFVRQLNKYDFHKIRFTDNKCTSSANQQAWEFQHPLFRRDQKQQLGRIHRKVNNNRSRQAMQRQRIGNSTLTPNSASEYIINDSDNNNKNNNNNNGTDRPASASATHLQASLQEQIDKLSATQRSMESTLSRLLATDDLMLEELHGLKRRLDEKDSIISALLEQPKHHRSVYSAQQQHPLHISSPMLSPQSPSLKLYPWLHPTSTSPPSSITPPITIMHAPSNSNSSIKSESDNSSTSMPPTSLPTMSLITLPSINTSSPPQPLTLAPSPTSATSLTSRKPSLAEEEKQATTCHGWNHQPKVLVVEDNVMYRRISMRCLQRLGCDFDLACDGLEAVACMKTSKYDLILMDISIPKLDGMAATRKLRQYDQHTPVVSMTASYSDHDIENYVGSGMSDLLPKPFDQYKLYDILKQHCAHLI